ncbi:MAG: DUF6933 domain-containing protein [Gammaproteobacteria bacterium]
MQLIRCSQKLLQEMGRNTEDLNTHETELSILGPWHANLIYIGRRKCLLFTNDKTFFNFLIPDVPRRQIRELDKLFLGFLQCILSDEGFEQNIKSQIQAEYHELGYAKINSANKVVLDTMNDLAFHYKVHIQSAGGLYRCKLPDIIRKMNRMPIDAIEGMDALDQLKNLFGSKH